MAEAVQELVLKSEDELAVMREAGRIVAGALQVMREALVPGITTKQLDTIAETYIRDHDAIPAFLGYQPMPHRPAYPATITACVNEELVHGIPSADVILQEGDIVSLDVACFYEGLVGDAAFTAAIGEVSPQVKRLIAVAEEALQAAIDASVIGNSISDVARATQQYVAKHGYSVAREYTGHGVGYAMHEPPSVPNWWSRNKRKQNFEDYPLQAGMTYAIEPMVIAGRNDLIELDDGWTVVTKDGSLCSHCEHTIAITESGPRILTLL